MAYAFYLFSSIILSLIIHSDSEHHISWEEFDHHLPAAYGIPHSFLEVRWTPSVNQRFTDNRRDLNVFQPVSFPSLSTFSVSLYLSHFSLSLSPSSSLSLSRSLSLSLSLSLRFFSSLLLAPFPFQNSTIIKAVQNKFRIKILLLDAPTISPRCCNHYDIAHFSVKTKTKSLL